MKTFTIANKQNNLLEVFSNLLISFTLADDLLEQKISPSKEAFMIFSKQLKVGKFFLIHLTHL